MLGKLLHQASSKLNNMDQTVNWPDPRFISYRENGKDKKIEKLDLSAEHCHSYIGKMQIDWGWTYSDETIIALLKYFFDNTKKGEKIVIELANKVSEILNGEESMELHMNYHQQKEHILELAKTLNKKRQKDLEIVDIKDNNKKLFDVLSNEWILWLDSEWELQMLWDSFDSLDIARRLYRVIKQDPNYFEEIKNLKSEEFRQISGESNYYGLIEMAIRINALLHGITLQWWVARQKKYDAVLLKHINPYIKDFPLLSDFQQFCWTALKENSFKWLYFDTEWSQKLINKIDAKNRIIAKSRNTLLLVIWLNLWIWGTYVVHNYYQKHNTEITTQEIIKAIFDNKKVSRSWEYGSWEYKGQEKLDKINEYMNEIYDRFIFRYGTIGYFSEPKFKVKILNCLNNQEILDMLWSEREAQTCVEDKIIDDYLVPQNIGEFKLNNVATSPYQSLLPYMPQFINTILLEEDFTVARDSTYKQTWNDFWLPDQHVLIPIGEFSQKENSYYYFSGYKYKFFVTSDGKYILSSGGYYGETDENTNISTSMAKDLAIDLIKQTHPIISVILDQYLFRYYKWEDSNGRKNRLSKAIESLLIKDFLRKWLLTKITPDQLPEIDNYLSQFVSENIEALKSITDDDVNKNLLPNGFLEQYEAAINNTILNQDYLSANYWRYPASSYGNKEYVVEHVWKYKALDGSIYSVWIIKFEGKPYLYADQYEPTKPWEKSYGPYEGEIVARDYLKQTRPIVKKLLNLYITRYYGWKNPESIYERMESILIEDFVHKWLVKKTDADTSMTNQEKLPWLIKYLDDFVIRNHTELIRINQYENEWLNKDVVPNKFLHKDEEAMLNTIENNEKITEAYSKMSNFLILTTQIREYKASDWETYGVRTANINGVNYICAEKKWPHRVSSVSDYIDNGILVAKDYFKTKADFYEKKILLEKKLKSASQTHNGKAK